MLNPFHWLPMAHCVHKWDHIVLVELVEIRILILRSLQRLERLDWLTPPPRLPIPRVLELTSGGAAAPIDALLDWLRHLYCTVTACIRVGTISTLLLTNFLPSARPSHNSITRSLSILIFSPRRVCIVIIMMRNGMRVSLVERVVCNTATCGNNGPSC